MASYNIMAAMPGSSFCWGSVRAAIEATTRHHVGFDNSGNGFDDMDILWTTALNRAEKKEITHFAMVHSDISPQAEWLDVLIDELDKHDADLVSGVVALKDWRGITTTGISHPEDHWGGFRRLAVRELQSLPGTFSAVDMGYGGWPLLINTGCWVADLRKPVFSTLENGELAINLNFPRKTHRVTGDDGKEQWQMLRESEDWHFSRCLHRHGARYFATSLCRTVHYNGSVPFPSYGNWGRESHDEETRPVWERGPLTHLDLDGWFDFADIYRERVQAVNGKPAYFVEVGSWLGKSAAYMGNLLKASGKQIRFDAVDNWLGGTDSEANRGEMNPTRQATKEAVKARGDIYQQWERNLSACGVAEYVRPVKGDSAKTAEFYPDKSLDFVFIDADHEAKAVYADMEAWWPKVKPGGILAGHDYDERGPREGATTFLRTKAITPREVGRCFVVEMPQ